ncbi:MULTISPECIES: DUF4214 domain-containing protein [unclassified Chelatococcus]|uniref:DUF4214 domain-containing protein n=2 Tax=Chelatococcus TaxID=28209 RepID=UPI001BCD5320|nr:MULTISPECIES: DUF4214 domain-containing protein [unclassified Chelatococcus]CAH1670461.1 conserved hypothetical protein [Hyphomicrobiales bacterium]MBS7739202.1 DUF4214 domain-containing protein [Chelatococcus sp. HY11]MBX3543692.1 DUF4214 domain-containing protein [Chelatococcus sp.]MCO5076265.1 DUF4214 domain-containing protein [Chelatococcus sp.]CAH1677351.1 conserved hypothetical protein [Hyphomicrobiales bacterium]
MAEVTLTEYFKTSAHDVVDVNVSNSITYGLGGNDRFKANTEAVFAAAAGGWGDDTYVPGGGLMVVADHGGGYDVLNLDEFFSIGDLTASATLDGGKHLVFINNTTKSAVIIANWRDPNYKVEEFQAAGQVSYSDQFIQIIEQDPTIIPDMKFSDLATVFEGKFAAVADKARFEAMLGLIGSHDLAATLQAEAQGVGRLYEAGLNRMADIAGLNFWYDAYMEWGRDKITLARAIIESAEFQQNFGNAYTQSAESYVNVLYLNVLGRKSDAAGAFYWTELLNTGALSREGVLMAFADSAENMAQSAYLAGIVDAGGGEWAFS